MYVSPVSRLENLKMNAEFLICFIDFLRTSLEHFSDWLIYIQQVFTCITIIYIPLRYFSHPDCLLIWASPWHCTAECKYFKFRPSNRSGPPSVLFQVPQVPLVLQVSQVPQVSEQSQSKVRAELVSNLCRSWTGERRNVIILSWQ